MDEFFVRPRKPNAYTRTHSNRTVMITPALLPPDTPADISEFYAHWCGLPRDRLVPHLHDYLDTAPAHLQPYVGISDINSPTDIRLRLLGTGIVDLSGRDPTGGPMMVLYAESLRAPMAKMVWQVVTRPTAYICVRSIRTKGGNMVHCPSICLPLHNTPSPVPLVMTYAHVIGAGVGLAPRDKFDMVQDLRVTHWIDIGAGVPEA